MIFLRVLLCWSSFDVLEDMASPAIELIEPRTKALGALRGMVRILSGEEDLLDQFQSLTDLVGKFIDADAVAFQLHHPEGGLRALEALLREPEATLPPFSANVLVARFSTPVDALEVPWEAAGRALGQIQARGSRRGAGFDADDELILQIAGELGGAVLLRRWRTTPKRQPFALSRREEIVAALVARGYTNAGIARELTIARATVATHVAHILAKLNFRSRAQIAAWVARETERGSG